MKIKSCRYLFIVFLFLNSIVLFANSDGRTMTNEAGVLFDKVIEGRISDTMDVPLIGVSVHIKGTNSGTLSNMTGHYSITVPNENTILEFSFIGYETQEISVSGRSTINVTLRPSTAAMEEVVVTAFGTEQKKESVTGAISTVKPSELRVPASNLTSGFAGKLPGVIAFQRSGEPGLDDAQFFIRGITSFSGAGKLDPLILVDGIEMTSRDLARLNVDDIASFSILKDANASALYGARGANGVILISTKEGKEDKLNISVRGELSHSYNSEMVKLADPITFMKMYNEAVKTRDVTRPYPNSLAKIRNTELGTDPILYPVVDWYDLMIANKATNKRLNLNLTGGGHTVQYYLAANYQNDRGILKENKGNIMNNNINIDRLQVRSNVTISFTPATKGIVRAYGTFDKNTGPGGGGAAYFSAARNANPVLFLPVYPADSANEFTNHILFGKGPEGTIQTNPYADVVSNFATTNSSMMLIQMEMEHQFKIGTLRGLTIRGVYNTMSNASNNFFRGYSPFYYALANTIDGSYKLTPLNPDQGTEYLGFGDGIRSKGNSMYGEVRATYSRIVNDVHDFSGTLVGTIRSEEGTSYVDRERSNRLEASLPRRNISTAGRLAYGYDTRYYIEFNYGLNGSERFDKAHRWGFFPSIGFAWNLQNESFLKDHKDVLSELKLRGTYGWVGNDQIGDIYDRFFYISSVNMNGPGYTFGMGSGTDGGSGISINRYANPDVTWEIAKKTNLGIDIGLFNDFTLNTDFYWETRTNILQKRADIPTLVGLRSSAIPSTNVGIAKGYGIESSLSYQKTFSSKTWMVANGNFTYATARYFKYEEPDYSDAPWRSMVGTKINQPRGYIAERLFVDDKEVFNSPAQQLGEYMAGDLKYKDLNGDGVINSDDMVPIGFPTVPEIIYGAGISFGYEAFDLSVFFQGSARSSFFISPNSITPFINDGQRAVMQIIADDYWSVNNRNLDAFWPRLSDYPIANNNVNSTHWLRNGAFVRLKSAEIGYTLPRRLVNRAAISNLRVYLNGLNLMYWSKFKLWDPEMAGNGLGYPIQRVFNLGVKIDL